MADDFIKDFSDWEVKMEIKAESKNEAFARMSMACFASRLNPTVEEIDDIKTAVSEAVTNCIIHAYRNKTGKINIMCKIHNKNEFYVKIEDYGCGIPNIETAMEPLYTSAPELERSGMGFAFMEAFMDDLYVESECGVGTKVIMRKIISGK